MVAVSCGCEKVRPAAVCHRESAKKFALRAQNTPNSAFLCLLGEFFRGKAAGGAVLGEFFRGKASEGAVLGEFCRGMGPAWRSCLLEGLINLVSSFSLHGLVECP